MVCRQTVQVEWETKDDQLDEEKISNNFGIDFSWEPVSNMLKDIPELVYDYFKCKNLNLESMLDANSKQTIEKRQKKHTASKNEKVNPK